MTMIEKLPDDMRPERYGNLNQVIDYFCTEHAQRPAFTSLGHSLSYAEVDELSRRFAHYLITQTTLKPGDRIAIQIPNLLQFPIAFYGAVRAGLIVVNTNPLYTAQEMAHQFKDSGVKAIVILSAAHGPAHPDRPFSGVRGQKRGHYALWSPGGRQEPTE